MNLSKIAIIGAGGGGLSFGTYLAMKGMSISIYDNDFEKIEKFKRKKQIKVTGLIDTNINSLTFTDSIQEAVLETKLIIVSITTNNIADVAYEISPFIKSDQIIILNPGHTFGAIEFVHNLKLNGVTDLPIIAETQDLIFACRLDNDYDLKINGMKQSMDIATYDPNDVDEVTSILSSYFPIFNAVENVWTTSLNNISAIIHPIPTLLNISRIEGESNYKYYYDGITKTIAKVMDLADQERLSIGKALDIELISTVDWMKTAYKTSGDTIYECIQNNKVYSQVLGPKTLEHRFIYEDILSGLVPIVSMGNKLNVMTKTLETFIDLGELISERNYRKEGRTLEKIGLGHMEVKDIKNLF